MNASASHHAVPSRLAINRIGLWLFILSESFLFLALLSTRFYLQGVQRPPDMNQPLGLAISLVLLLSSLSAYSCEMATAHGDLKGFRLKASNRRSLVCSIVTAPSFAFSTGIACLKAPYPPNTCYHAQEQCRYWMAEGSHRLFTGLEKLLSIEITTESAYNIAICGGNIANISRS